MSRVWLISNVYGDLQNENANMKKIMAWRYETSTEKRFEEIGFAKDHVQVPLIGSRAQEYQIKTPSGLILDYTKMIAKGIAILNHFHTILKPEYQLADDDLIVYFDGDGQIDYNQTIKIAEKLKTCDFVLSDRGEKAGISDERFLIERFENSFIEEKFSIELADVQCGCWGLTGRHLKRIFSSLNAEGFEIELDLTICSLENGIAPAYMAIDVLAPEVSTFKGSEDHLKKLLYLMKKFKLDQVSLIEKAQRFAHKYRELPLEYSKYFTYDAVRRIKFN